MTLILLEEKERLHFRDYLLQELETETKLLEQTKLLGSSMEGFAKVIEDKIIAYKIVTRTLQTTEEILIQTMDKDKK